MPLTRKENGVTIHVSPWSHDVSTFFRGNTADFILNSPGLSESADQDHKVFVDSNDSSNFVTVRRFRALVGRLANVLKNKYSIKPGDSVCIISTNNIFISPIHIAILAVGAVVSPANIAYLPHELNHQFNVSQSKLVIGSKQFIKTAIDATSPSLKSHEVREIITVDSIIQDAEAPNTSWDEPIHFTPEESENKHAYYCFSSGTSGVPKGVMTTHFNMISNVYQQHIACPDVLYPPDNVYAGILPMSHIYGLSTFVHTLPSLGRSTIVIFDSFNFEVLLKKVIEHKITFLHVVPPMAVLFAKSPIVDNYPAVKQILKVMMSGAAPLSQSIIEEINTRFSNNTIIRQAYGLTETSPMLTMSCWPGTKNYDVESCGWLIPGSEARLVNAEGEDVHGVGHENRGEVWIRGPSVMAGYLNNPQATKDTFDSTGQWFKTGDIGVVSDEGQWYIVDRVKELIKSKGHQVAPAELESILLEHDDIIDAAVTGIYLPEEGTELPRAFVILRSNDVDPLKIKTWFDGKVARHKQLWGGIVVVDQIPKTASGKIQRRFLRDRKDDIIHGYKTGGTKAKL